MTYTVHEADVLEALRAMPSDSYHGALTDPPYGLTKDGGKTGFMGHTWDKGVPPAEVWREVLRVLKPGAHLLAFGGTRTFHRLTCAIEDAGFEVRDCLLYLYGAGFPKSHNISKAIDREAGATRPIVGRANGVGTSRTSALGAFASEYNVTSAASAASAAWSGYGSSLKPAYEPVIVARKPLTGTLAANCQEHGCGGLAIDACRIEGDSGSMERREAAARSGKAGRQTAGAVEDGRLRCNRDAAAALAEYTRARPGEALGRWPANVILDEEAGAILDAQSGSRGGHNPASGATLTGASNSRARGSMRGVDATPFHGKVDGASRFFFTAKASKSERNAGLSEPNVHPCLKPLALTRYLARLILPPIEGTRLLTPFCGSGSEMIGALQAGWSHVEGIDSWDVAVRIARARLAHHEANLPKQLTLGGAA